MKANPDKCHFFCSSNLKTSITIENRQIHNTTCEKLLGAFFDSKFQSHIDSICKKTAHKLKTISRITSYMDFKKRKLVENSFFSSQFNYCPLIWMCHNRTYNNKINRLHERCLRLIYNNKCSSFLNIYLLQNATVLLQNARIITKCDVCYKL